MKLVKWDAHGEVVVSDDPNALLIEDTVRSLDWNTKDLVGVTLRRDALNWAEGSGSFVEGGLSAMLEEDGVQYVSKAAPPSLDELIDYLRAYLRGERRKVFELLEGQRLSDDQLAELTAQAESQQRSSLGVIVGLLTILGFIVWLSLRC